MEPARRAFRDRFASDEDYRLYMRGLAQRPRHRKGETHEQTALRRGVSVATARRYREIEQHPDLVEAVYAGSLSRAAALREARLRRLPYAQQLEARSGIPTPVSIADGIRRIVNGEIDLAAVILALVPDPTAEEAPGYMLLADVLKQLRDGS